MSARPAGMLHRLPKWFLVFLPVSVLVLTSSCSGQQAVSKPQFKGMPPVSQWNKPNLMPILGPVTGTGPRTFTILSRTGIAIELGCIGKGWVRLKGPNPVEDVAPCGDGSNWSGGLTDPTHIKPGQKITVRVVAPETTRWKMRISGTPVTRS